MWERLPWNRYARGVGDAIDRDQDACVSIPLPSERKARDVSLLRSNCHSVRRLLPSLEVVRAIDRVPSRVERVFVIRIVVHSEPEKASIVMHIVRFD